MPSPWGPAEGVCSGSRGQDEPGRDRGAGGSSSWAHLSSSAGDQRGAAGARHRPRSTNATTMAERRAGRPALGQRGRGGAHRSAPTAPPVSRRAPRGSAAPARDFEGAGRCQLSQEGPSPSAAPVSAPAARPAPGPRRPSWGRQTPGGVAGLRAPPGPPPQPRPRLSAITQGSRGLGRGGRAPGRVPHTWPGRGASLQAPNPRLWSVGFSGRGGRLRFPSLSRESRPSPTVTRATVGVAAARLPGRGCAWIGFSGARGGVADWFLLKMAPSLRPEQAEGERRGRAVVPVQV